MTEQEITAKIKDDRLLQLALRPSLAQIAVLVQPLPPIYPTELENNPLDKGQWRITDISDPDPDNDALREAEIEAVRTFLEGMTLTPVVWLKAAEMFVVTVVANQILTLARHSSIHAIYPNQEHKADSNTLHIPE